MGLINCGSGNANTIIFSLNVPDAELPALSAELAGEGPTGDITINGNFYSWQDCEILINNLNGVITIITLSPNFDVNPIGTEHTVTALVNTNIGTPEGVTVAFEVNSGPNAGLTSDSAGFCSPNPDCTTDANGEVSWTYTSNGATGTDTILSSVNDIVIGAVASNSVEK